MFVISTFLEDKYILLKRGIIVMTVTLNSQLNSMQLDLERSRQSLAIKHYIENLLKAAEYNRFNETPEGRLLISLGIDPFIEQLNKYLEVPLVGITAKDRLWVRMCTDSPEVLAFIVISTIVSGIDTKGKPLTSVCRKIGQNLKKLLKVSETMENAPNFIAYLGKKYARAKKALKKQLVMEAIESFQDMDMKGAPRDVRVGGAMLDLFVKSGANVIRVFKASDKTLMVALTMEAEMALVNAVSREKLLIATNYFPMVCPPNNWVNARKGGYLTTNIPLVKAYTKAGRAFFSDQVPDKVLGIINKLQHTPFRVNKRMLALIKEVYEKNIIDPDTLSSKVPNLVGGLPTSNIITIEELLPYTYSPETYKEYKDKKNELEILLQIQRSKRLQLLLTLDMANTMKNYDKFYYVYQVDYRGRLYSHINFLSPQAPAYVKSMLEFSKGESLTERGEYWLKIHIANCYGLDKKSFEDRIEWVEKNETSIMAIGLSPLDNVQDWYKADSPFEFVAGCMAYVDHLEGNPVHLPIGLDATNSGVQFYSMLLKDEVGAEAVNLKNTYEIVEVSSDYTLRDDEEFVTPTSVKRIVRADIYKQVANKVNKYLEDGDYPKEYTFTTSDGETHTVSTIVEANSLKGKITRSLVKRNTMTVPYSVTKRGMYAQLSDEFYDITIKNKVFWEGEEWVCLKLLTDLNYKAIYEIITGAKEGQEAIKASLKDRKDVARWITPIYKFPVFQPSFKNKALRVSTPMGSLQIFEETDELDRRAQSNAIAPNVIHSLDSTLLYYVIEHFKGDLATVHDCFYVHPNKGDEVRHHYKKGMCELMEMDVLKNITEQLAGHLIELPEYGGLTSEDIMNSKYIIS